MPLTWLSFLFDAHFFSAITAEGKMVLSPLAFHAQNLFWHAASVLLLFGLLHRLTGGRWRSFLVAGLFALHPMHVESVAWAAERKDVLSVFFGLLTLWAYAGSVERPSWQRRLGMTAIFLLCLLSKPMLITLPFVLLLLDLWPFRRWGAGPNQQPFRRLVLEKAPMFALSVLIAFVTLDSRWGSGSLVSLDALPLSARLANALTAYGWYLASTFWPSGLALLYPHPYENWSPAPALAGAGALFLGTFACVRQVGSRPYLAVGWFWFVGALFPVSGLAQGGAQAWADRFSYWPHIGLFVAVVWGAAELLARLAVPGWLAGALGAVVLGGLAAVTWVQVGYWRNSATVWERTLAVTKDNALAHQNLSRSYRRAGRLEEADYHFAQAAGLQLKRLAGILKPRKPMVVFLGAAPLDPGGRTPSVSPPPLPLAARPGPGEAPHEAAGRGKERTAHDRGRDNDTSPEGERLVLEPARKPGRPGRWGRPGAVWRGRWGWPGFRPPSWRLFRPRHGKRPVGPFTRRGRAGLPGAGRLPLFEDAAGQRQGG
jgi:hypothetical protein